MSTFQGDNDVVARGDMGAADVVSAIDEPSEVDRSAVSARVHQIFAAAQDKDFDRLASFHLYDTRFTKFDDFEPLDRQDAETARRSEEEGLGAVSEFRYRLEDFKVDVFGPAAITTFVLDYGFQVDGERVDARARSTLVLINNGGEWRIAHEHFSPFKSNP